MKTKRNTSRLLLIGSSLLLVSLASGYIYRRVQLNQLHSALVAAVDRNDMVAIRALLKQGAAPNAPVLPADRRTPAQRLWDILLLRHFPTYAIPLLNYTILPREFRGTSFNSMYYKFHDRPDIVEALLDAGAVLETRAEGENPLLEAARYGELETMKVLLAHGADVNAADQYGQTALVYTASLGDAAGVEFLLHHGANIHDTAGETTVIMAALDMPMMGNPKLKTKDDMVKTVRCLLSHGAQVTGKTGNGKTILTLAEEWNDSALTQLLKQAGAR